MKSPRWLSSSSPMGVSRDTGSWDIFIISDTRSTGRSSLAAISSVVGSLPNSCKSWREVRTRRLMVSTIWTGIRMVLAWSAIALVMAWRIHHVA